MAQLLLDHGLYLGAQPFRLRPCWWAPAGCGVVICARSTSSLISTGIEFLA